MIGLRDSGAELKQREKGGDSNRAKRSGVGQQIKHTDWIFSGLGEVLQEVGRTSKVGWVGSTENRRGGARYRKDWIKIKKDGAGQRKGTVQAI